MQELNKVKDILKYIINYFFFLIKSKSHGGYGIHSPFVYEFSTQVLNSPGKTDELSETELLVAELKQNEEIIQMIDLGAPSRWAKSETRTIKSIARHSSSNIREGRMLYRLVKWYQPDTIIELGTCLGVSTMFMAKGGGTSRIITVEGNKQLIMKAEENLKKTGCKNVELVENNFESAVENFKALIIKKGIIYIDGNHQYTPTINYFNTLIKILQEGCVIIDDIRWSEEMKKAWNEIVKHKQTTVSIDLFDKGIIFKKEGLSRQHFKIRY